MSTRLQAFIIDGSSFLYRALYALKPMHTLTGMQVGAVYGFCRILKKLLQKHTPTYVIIAWDSKGPTERHQLLASYKATRDVIPQELINQKDLIQKFAQEIGICQISLPGIEADDIMYSLAKKLVTQDIDVVLVTNDKDLGQIVSEHITLYDAFKETVIDRNAIIAKYGVPPEKLSFYFGLVGDSSDNIPGVKGIGPKSAQKIVEQFSCMQELYNNLNLVEEKIRNKLELSREDGFLSEQLFILREHRIHYDLSTCQFKQDQWQQARRFFAELNFTSLLKELAVESEAPYFSFSDRYHTSFRLITTEDELLNLCAKIKFHGACAIDTEITGKNPLQSALVGISCAVEHGEAFYLPTGHNDGNNIAKKLLMDRFKPLLEDASIKKYLQNAKFDMHVLAHYGIALQNIDFDTMIAAGLTSRNDERIGLKFLSQKYLNQEMITFQDFIDLHSAKNIAQVSAEATMQYAGADAHQTLQLVSILDKKLHEEQQTQLFRTIEMPLMSLLQEMEQTGIILDVQRLESIAQRVTKDLANIQHLIIKLVGSAAETINLNSPQQIERLLFVDLQLTPLKKTGNKSRHSTDREVLQELAQHHPVPALIVKYRELYKLKSTYLDALPSFVNPETGRIHTSFSQVSTATGRLSSSEPNMQNIPVEPNELLSVRSAFKAPDGHVFLSADYSQIELRVLAYLSQDEHLLTAFANDEDIHSLTASRLFDTLSTNITHEQRQLGKRINFSILYGLTPYGLSKDLMIPVSQAKEYIEKYRAQFPRVQEWANSVIATTQKDGYVTTLWGRRRYIPGIYEHNRHLFDLACRIAINTKAQGTAAEIVKLAMIRCAQVFKKMSLPAQLILQIHDELLITVSEDHAHNAANIVRHELETIVSWNVPLKVTTRIGRDWGEVTK